MDERLRTFLLILGSGAFLGLLGALFGGVAGWSYWKAGRASGTALGLGVADAFDRAARRPLRRGPRGAVVGAVDGFVFLGAVGVAVGAALVVAQRDRPEVLLRLAGSAVLLALAALAFGLLAYGMVRAGVRALAGVLGGGTVGGLTGLLAASWVGLLFGSVLGCVAGTVATLTLRRPPR